MGTVVDVVGSGPATESLLATLDDLDVSIDHREAPAVDSADFAVVVDETGAATFETAIV